MSEQIDPHKAIDHIYRKGQEYAQAKANRVYLEEYRKSLKAILMKKSGESTVSAQEREAYSHPDYLAHLDGLKAAVQVEEGLRWGILVSLLAFFPTGWFMLRAARTIAVDCET